MVYWLSILRFVFFFFKQKTAYEIMPSLVGSEMCIRDRYNVFSPSMIDGVIRKLKAYNDVNLREELQNKPMKMKEVVDTYFHCGQKSQIKKQRDKIRMLSISGVFIQHIIVQILSLIHI
eukprot:TRINITY_DN9329_c0_g1_i6.p2 TRINITY_DN9329_c0_g1~~TRINITY_DN9329_c0_g1_i6.p2  ORF type:complete len:119 (+),score=13.79 TRINITY_DN9329_c0_g1_i6:13-369(+)